MNKYLDNLKQKFNEDNSDLPLIRFESFEKIPFIEHGFTTRLGGVSKGIYSTLNLSFARGDEEKAVLENYRIVGRKIGYDIDDFAASHQTHTTNIRIVSKEDKGKGIIRERDYEDVDGLMTNEPGIVLFTYYADCVPLYFVDTVKKVIALSHSGWKGTVNKMGKVTVDKMVSEYGCDRKDIICAIGPSICRKCYEISEDVAIEFKNNFLKEDVEQFLDNKHNGKYQLDLWKVNELILKEAGISENHIENRRICTCCNKDVLFSHRGLNGQRGNLAAFMVIK
ncbi:MAG: peptidoglycan editing factor PgeF [Lachnospiraceae bacterium]|nr:peptidoglycan editing factor PgeF [Clostridiales bacterium]MDD6293351.1 peptidoglycan editing factor PgeF [Eubacteriales bacterium]MDY2607802.1 peptidoglycan editing factor PgeF [Lachnospiraceae bacterium]